MAQAQLTWYSPILKSFNPVVRTNATIFGNPEYLRLSGNATLNVNIAGKNETSSTLIVVEVNFGH
jgi:hypothetical protein